MSFNFDVNSNLSLVRRLHTMENFLKCVNFILTVPVFFSNQLYVGITCCFSLVILNFLIQ
jgi:hypothetical protein